MHLKLIDAPRFMAAKIASRTFLYHQRQLRAKKKTFCCLGDLLEALVSKNMTIIIAQIEHCTPPKLASNKESHINSTNTHLLKPTTNPKIGISISHSSDRNSSKTTNDDADDAKKTKQVRNNTAEIITESNTDMSLRKINLLSACSTVPPSPPPLMRRVKQALTLLSPLPRTFCCTVMLVVSGVAPSVYMHQPPPPCHVTAVCWDSSERKEHVFSVACSCNVAVT